MLTPIGEMREAVRIVTLTVTQDEAGGEVKTYVPGDLIWLAIRPLSTTEAVQLGQVNAEISHVAFGHYESLRYVRADDRVRMEETGEEFDVAGLPVYNNLRDWARLNLISRPYG